MFLSPITCYVNLSFLAQVIASYNILLVQVQVSVAYFRGITPPPHYDLGGLKKLGATRRAQRRLPFHVHLAHGLT